jgi:hypothetical protein
MDYFRKRYNFTEFDNVVIVYCKHQFYLFFENYRVEFYRGYTNEVINSCSCKISHIYYLWLVSIFFIDVPKCISNLIMNKILV